MPKQLDMPGVDILADKEQLKAAYGMTFNTEAGQIVLAHLQALIDKPALPLVMQKHTEALIYDAAQKDFVRHIEQYARGIFDPSDELLQTEYDTEGGEYA